MKRSEIKRKLEELYEAQQKCFALTDELLDEFEKYEHYYIGPDNLRHLFYINSDNIIGDLDGYGIDSVEESMQNLEAKMKRGGIEWEEELEEEQER